MLLSILAACLAFSSTSIAAPLHNLAPRDDIHWFGIRVIAKHGSESPENFDIKSWNNSALTVLKLREEMMDDHHRRIVMTTPSDKPEKKFGKSGGELVWKAEDSKKDNWRMRLRYSEGKSMEELENRARGHSLVPLVEANGAKGDNTIYPGIPVINKHRNIAFWRNGVDSGLLKPDFKVCFRGHKPKSYVFLFGTINKDQKKKCVFVNLHNVDK